MKTLAWLFLVNVGVLSAPADGPEFERQSLNEAGKCMYTVLLSVGRDPGPLNEFVTAFPEFTKESCTLLDLRHCADEYDVLTQNVSFSADSYPSQKGVYVSPHSEAGFVILKVDAVGDRWLIRPPSMPMLVSRSEPSGLAGIALRVGNSPELQHRSGLAYLFIGIAGLAFVFSGYVVWRIRWKGRH